MLDARFSHLYFYQSLNRLQRGLSAIAELLVEFTYFNCIMLLSFTCLCIIQLIEQNQQDICRKFCGNWPPILYHNFSDKFCGIHIDFCNLIFYSCVQNFVLYWNADYVLLLFITEHLTQGAQKQCTSNQLTNAK